MDRAIERLLVVFGAASEHGIEAQAKEGRHHRQNDNLDNHALVPLGSSQ
jgi:hypothetical protein